MAEPDTADLQAEIQAYEERCTMLWDELVDDMARKYDISRELALEYLLEAK